jgi:hypothetical protein
VEEKSSPELLLKRKNTFFEFYELAKRKKENIFDSKGSLGR